jgi:hypothetical protein
LAKAVGSSWPIDASNKVHAVKELRGNAARLAICPVWPAWLGTQCSRAVRARLHPRLLLRTNICVFCDGSVHDDALQMTRDGDVRAELRARGYRVVVIRYYEDLAEQIGRYFDIFGRP